MFRLQKTNALEISMKQDVHQQVHHVKMTDVFTNEVDGDQHIAILKMMDGEDHVSIAPRVRSFLLTLNEVLSETYL